jgi:N-acetylmuramoyl-L-alanine amidase
MPKDYKARRGDCISSIAAENGFFWETIWNDSKNAALKRLRGDPNVILPGDVVHIKDKEERSEQAATEKKHSFRRKGVPAKLRIRLTEPEEEDEEAAEDTANIAAGRHDEAEYVENPQQKKARADIPYEIRIGAKTLEGRTDGDGFLEASIPPGTRSAELVLFPGTEEEEVYPLRLGQVDPIEALEGVRERLGNLGYAVDEGHEMSPALEDALRLFQEHNEIEVTGQADKETLDKLSELHGC